MRKLCEYSTALFPFPFFLVAIVLPYFFCNGCGEKGIHEDYERMKGKQQISKEGQQISLDEYAEFLSRSIRFDYCGIQELGLGEYKPWQKLVRWRLCIEYSRSKYISDMVAFQNLAEKCERAISRGDREMFDVAGDGIVRTLRDEKQKCLSVDFKFSPFDYLSNIAKIEYMLSRSVTNGYSVRKDFLKGDDITTLLPDDLFSADFSNIHWACVDRLHLVRLQKFRDMLVVGLWVSQKFGYTSGDGKAQLTDAIKVSSELKARLDATGLKFSASNHVWQLFWTHVRHGHDVLPFNAYIPVIDGIGGLQSNDMWLSTKDSMWISTKDCLWLSSDYTKKRKELYEKGCYNDKLNHIVYEMIDGKVRKR